MSGESDSEVQNRIGELLEENKRMQEHMQALMPILIALVAVNGGAIQIPTKVMDMIPKGTQLHIDHDKLAGVLKLVAKRPASDTMIMGLDGKPAAETPAIVPPTIVP